MLLVAGQLDKQYGDSQVLRQVSLDVRQGECFGIIGPNGSGKSTLMKLLSGVEDYHTGMISLLGRPLNQFAKKELARNLAVLEQETMSSVGFTVREVVEMGRYPYQNWLGDEAEDQAPFIDTVMEELSLLPLADRPFDRLSGGEKQRVALAKVMVQQPLLLMLDEPTASLDIGYQQQMMNYIHRKRESSNLTVIAVLHDLNLAAQYCDRLMVLHHGQVVRIGTPQQVIQPDLLEQVYGVRPLVIEHPHSGVPQILLT